MAGEQKARPPVRWGQRARRSTDVQAERRGSRASSRRGEEIAEINSTLSYYMYFVLCVGGRHLKLGTRC